MNTGKRVCVFVDGENLRHSIVELFPEFDRRSYLPRANWSDFFDWIVCEAVDVTAERVRAYWYSVQNIDFSPFNIENLARNPAQLEAILMRDEKAKEHILSGKDKKEKNERIQTVLGELRKRQETMEKRFAGWTRIQDSITGEHMAIEFRRAGSIRYDLFNERLGKEKAVDVKLATDLIRLKDIYDVAVIVSGDQDYVPAVEAIKDAGKRVVGVAFKQEDGFLLPGGAKRLNQATDWGIEVDHATLKKHLGI